MTEFYKEYRPVMFGDVMGQDAAVAELNTYVKNKTVPQCMLFSGPSGCGKTTLARILANKLNCGEWDFIEKNCAKERGIDMVRDISLRMTASRLGGDNRVYILDECHRLTGDSMSAMLKMLEDTPPHVYFFLCTTNPEQLLDTIRNRCTPIKLRSLKQDEITKVVNRVLQDKKQRLSDAVMYRLVEAADGSARQSLVLLNKVLTLANEQDRLECLDVGDAKVAAINICRALADKRNKWGDIAKILKNLDEEPEKVRRAVLGYAGAILRNGAENNQAYLLLCAFESNFYDSGRDGLTRACYECFKER